MFGELVVTWHFKYQKINWEIQLEQVDEWMDDTGIAKERGVKSTMGKNRL